jgi:hypothetical protein
VFFAETSGSVASSPDRISSGQRGVRIMVALSRIRRLTDGWLGDGSLAPTKSAIDRLAEATDAVNPQARISPAADGSILIEWEQGDREFLVSIERDSSIVFIEEDATGHLIREDERPFSSEELRRALSEGTAA